VIRGSDVQKWLSSARQAARPQSAVPRLEALEDRLVPSGAPTLDLTTPGAIGAINGAIFLECANQPTGTGVIRSFVRLQTPNGKATVEQGYNTDVRPLQFDENNSPQFTRALHLSELPVVNVGGANYREFLLDINQKSSQPYLSLDELRLYVGGQAPLWGYDAATQQLGGQTAVYDMGGGNWVKLDARLNHGSGSGDMLLCVPDAAFGAAPGTDPYVTLYSKFGVNCAANGGFEEWAPGAAGLIPAGGSISGVVTQSGAAAAGVTVFIDANHDGVWEPGEAITTTDANGNYTFTNLATGLGSFSSYQVTVIAPPSGVGQPPATVVPLYSLVQLQNPNQAVNGINFDITADQLPPS
jgi:hypothetical protein